MLNLRPRLGEQFLERRRLLERLPEEPGYVVWLQAPYGYGKSILAAQWGQELEAQGWRVVWVSVADGDIKALTARTLGLPAGVPWKVVSSALWERPTLLVLEDLAEDAALSPLLEDLGGLLLLAGRKVLHDPGLLKLLASGRVTKLEAVDLAFDPDEARALIPERSRCAEALAISQGWPLPLHFTALTGRVPERRALLEGIRASVTPDVWREVLFLASLSRLPGEFKRETTEVLAEAGFVQRLEDGYRLHPLAAETVLQTFPDEVREVVLREAKRLSPLLQGEAYAAAGLLEELGILLEDASVDLARQDAETILRWDRRLPPGRGPVRTQRVGYALAALGQTDEGIELILRAGELEQSPDRKLDLYKDAVWWLASLSRFAEALGIAELAEPHLGAATPEVAGRFLNNRAYIHFAQGDWGAAERGYVRALEYFPAAGENSRRYIAETNLGVVRWHRSGDLEGAIAARYQALQHNKLRSPNNVPGDALQLGDLALLLGKRDSALQYFREARNFAKAHPAFALIADGRRAMVEGDLAVFPALWERSGLWSDSHVRDRVLASWVACLREQRMLDEALRVSEGYRGPWTDPQSALALHEAGRTAEARALLGERPPMNRVMEERLYWQAAKVLVGSEGSDLDALIHMTLVGARILPGLIPLEKLPKHRPDLTTSYPLTEVLASGWKEAVELRLGEMPPLELKVLGGFKVNVLGQDINLAGRHQEMLTLMALRVSKEALGEAIWPETEARKVKNNLYVHLNALRKILEPWGVSTYLDDVALTRTRADLWALEDALEAGDHQAVFDLYQGPLTPGIDVPLIAEAREDLHRRVVDALLEAGLADVGWHAESYLRRVIALDPLNETALQELLRRLVGRGRRAEAVRLYKAFSDCLKEELGIEPDEGMNSILGL
jgi:DNA-binding SARP family transcriptional activator/tetratricopeptide (TPR) repeat protein